MKFLPALLRTLCTSLLSLGSNAQTEGCTSPDACNYNVNATIDDGSCCVDNCVIMNMMDAFGDGWNGAEYGI